jgi:hypothetical protein
MYRGGGCSSLLSRFGSLTEHTRNEHLLAASHVLSDLDRDHISRRHALVEELDHALQLGRDHVSDKHETDTTGAQVRLRPLPELAVVKLGISNQSGDLREWIALRCAQALLEALAE